MTEKLNVKVVSITLAVTAGVVYLICALFYWLLPKQATAYFRDVFHGIDIDLILRQTPIPLGDTVTGFIEIIISALIIGALFALIFNSLSEKI